MIYEMRTYTLYPGSIAEAEKRFGEALPYREKYSKLTAFWHSDIGPLNQIIHVWGYQDLNERMRIRAESFQDPNWPPKIREFIVSQESKILIPAPFSPIK
ncbi:MAG: NIPSNAP family protein [Dehalococcoidia bacterium]